MNAKEQFALALRIIGILGLAYTLRTFVRNPSLEWTLLAIRLLGILIALYFIRGASLVVRFAYPGAP